MSSRKLIVVSLLAALAAPGCDRRAEASDNPGTTTSAAQVAAAVPAPQAAASTPAPQLAADPGGAAAPAAPASPVARIVFIGKENACQCTRAAIDASWAALQQALGGASIPIEQLYQDTQGLQVAPYKAMQAFFALPAIYFLDASGGLLGQLQGEVTADAIRPILFP